MKRIGIVYGSDTGDTEDVVKRLATLLGDVNTDLISVDKATIDSVSSYNNLILASSTWGDGELQSDWEDFEGNLESIDFKNKTVALVGLGDQDGYEDTFCNSMALLYDRVKEAKIVGQTSVDGYEFSQSESVIDGKFIGLAIDEINQDDLTQKRLENWVELIKQDFN